ncbi:FtsH protease activity modulator HflK [Bartonella sp. HY329]|uniref:FtsH protease activity modulator HflK n=1 Tax=unclassified Bartonella TaxID=2645622 RepID=UPI0021C96B15|nr:MULTISPECIES: FtsH protease activity modulator HflK [unclassified Bartonella]UXM95892.1 FtsH protease activity modulator HflK [Bartonella sp. HY329]UXN10217.1 FtsH protease activity modulator HflK [Bartonella sp. HY328]
MPWSNQSGGSGPSGGSGNKGGPWGGGGNNNDGNKSPWGRPNGSGNNGNNGNNNGGNGGGKGGPTPPDMDELLRKGQQKLQQFGSGFIILIVIILAVLFWLYKSIFFVEPNEMAIKLRFGVPQEDVLIDGGHFQIWPIESHRKVITSQTQISIGDNPTDSLMLTSDQNMVSVKFSVYYNVTQPEEYLFNVDKPYDTIKQVAESAMREVVGRRKMDDVLREKRSEVAADVLAIIKQTLAQYKIGVTVNQVALGETSPPQNVKAAFDLVEQAEQQGNQMRSNAEQYKAKKEGEAFGEISRLSEVANAYKARVIAEANGRAERFKAIAEQEKIAPDVTRYRIYVDTMEQILMAPNKLVIDKSNNGVVPYLPLNNMLQSQQSGNGSSGKPVMNSLTGQSVVEGGK